MMHAPSPRRRYLSVWLRRLQTDRLTRRRSPAPATQVSSSRLAQHKMPTAGESEIGKPLVVAEDVKGALRLSTMNDAAARLGLKVGMGLADVRAMYPAIAVVDADP